MRRLMMFLLMIYSVVSILLVASTANAQNYGHHRRGNRGYWRPYVAPPITTCLSILPGACSDPSFRVIPSSGGRYNRGYGRQEYYGREPYYDGYSDTYGYGPQVSLPRGPAVTGGVIGAMAGYAIRGDARGTVGGAAIGAGVGLIVQHRNNQREFARQVVYETHQREYEQSPSNSSVILVTNQTPWPISLMNQTTKSYIPLAPGASTEVQDGNFIAIMDVKGEMFHGVVTRSASGLVVNEPQIN